MNKNAKKKNTTASKKFNNVDLYASYLSVNHFEPDL